MLINELEALSRRLNMDYGGSYGPRVSILYSLVCDLLVVARLQNCVTMLDADKNPLFLRHGESWGDRDGVLVVWRIVHCIVATK